MGELDFALAANRDPMLRARLLNERASVEMDTGNVHAFRDAVAACRQAGDDRTLVDALNGLIYAYSVRGQAGEPVLIAAREAQAVARKLKDPSRIQVAEIGVGHVLFERKDADAARSVFESVLSHASPESFASFAASALLADLELIHGDANTALAGYCRCLRQLQQLGSRPNQALQLDGAATALARLGRAEEALVAATISDRMRDAFSFHAAPRFLADRDEALAPAREALGPAGQRHCAMRAAELGIDGGIAWAAALADNVNASPESRANA
jgi:tetratricopeptide (TPR) repeat protein